MLNDSPTCRLDSRHSGYKKYVKSLKAIAHNFQQSSRALEGYTKQAGNE